MKLSGATPNEQNKAKTAVPYALLADLVLIVHFGVVLFVMGGLLAVFVGNARGWLWVNTLSFRLTHVATIAVVVGQSWLGRWCPLTTLESWLRVQAGQPAYAQSFVEHWLGRLLFYDAPFWVFTVAYTSFGLLVLLAWLIHPPRRHTRGVQARGG